MRIKVAVVLLLFGQFIFAQNELSKWETVNIEDEFGDKTDEKRVAYQTTGKFSNSATSNSNLNVLILVDSPTDLSVVVFEYGKYKVNLKDAIFSYKIGKTIIDGVPLDGEFDMKYLWGFGL
jgi:hypothetical protein